MASLNCRNERRRRCARSCARRACDVSIVPQALVLKSASRVVQAAAEKQTLEESLTHQRAELSRVKASLDACTVELAAMGGALSEALSAHDSFRTISRREVCCCPRPPPCRDALFIPCPRQLQEADDQLAMAQRVGRELEASARSACVAREDALARTATLQREVAGLKLRLETVGSAMAVEMEEIERQLTEVQRTAAAGTCLLGGPVECATCPT